MPLFDITVYIARYLDKEAVAALFRTELTLKGLSQKQKQKLQNREKRPWRESSTY